MPRSGSPLVLDAVGDSMISERGYRSDIEGLRAVAVLLVLLFHANVEALSGGFIGVDVFFVISGFLITSSLLEEGQREGRIRLGEFYARRVRRLLPASAAVLASTAIGVVALLPNTMWREYGGDIAHAAGYVVNWRFAARSVDYLAEDVLASPVQHFWTLAVEEQFYLVWPLLLVCAVSLARRTGLALRPLTAGILAAFVTVPSLLWSVYATATNPAPAFFVTTTRMWELSIGALTAVAFRSSRIRSRGVSTGFRVLGVSAIVGTAVLVEPTSPWPGALALIPTIGTAMVIVAGDNGGRGDLVDRALALPPMQRIGAWSYSLYLWHWPLIAIMSARLGGLTTIQATLLTFAAVVPAWLSYRYLEGPLRYAPTLRSSNRLTLSFGGNLTLLGIAIGLVVIIVTPSTSVGTVDASRFPGARVITADVTNADLLNSLEQVDEMYPLPADATTDVPPLHADGCHVSQTEEVPVTCEYGDPSGALHVGLVGDSKAGQWVPGLIQVADEEGWRLTVATKSACELSLATPVLDDEPYLGCLEWSRGVLELLENDTPDVVLVSQGSSTALDTAGVESTEAMLEGMASAYQAIQAMGARVVMIADNPYPPFNVYECVAQNGEKLSECVFERERAMEAGGRSVQRQLAREASYVMIDLVDQICPTEMCMPIIGNVLVYRSGSHLTATYVESMKDALGERLSSILSPTSSDSS